MEGLSDISETALITLRSRAEESQGNDPILRDEEWPYFEEPNIKPKAFYALRQMKSMTRSQWTIKVKIG